MALTVQDIVGGKRNQVACGQNEVHTRLHQLSYIEVVGIHERCCGDTKHVSWVQLLLQGPLKELSRSLNIDRRQVVRQLVDTGKRFWWTSSSAAGLAGQIL